MLCLTRDDNDDDDGDDYNDDNDDADDDEIDEVFLAKGLVQNHMGSIIDLVWVPPPGEGRDFVPC